MPGELLSQLSGVISFLTLILTHFHGELHRSFMTFLLLAVSSGGAISSKMSWAEFRIVFSWLGFVGLSFGVAHQAMWGAILHKHRPNPSFWVGGGVIVSVSFQMNKTMTMRIEHQLTFTSFFALLCLDAYLLGWDHHTITCVILQVTIMVSVRCPAVEATECTKQRNERNKSSLGSCWCASQSETLVPCRRRGTTTQLETSYIRFVHEGES